MKGVRKGLAAYLAAGQDDAAVGYLGLDSVDAGGLGANADPADIPALFLLAEPSLCNARGNFRAIIDNLHQSRTVVLTGASHCHLELPYDQRCSWVCGRSSDEETRALQARAIATTLDWLETHFADKLGVFPSKTR